MAGRHTEAFEAKARSRDGIESRNGFVLLCVLWVLAILTVVTLGFGQRTLLDRRAAALSVDSTQVRFMARGAVERGLAEVRNRVVVQRIVTRRGTYIPFEQWPDPPDLLQKGGLYQLDSADYQDDTCNFEIRDAERFISLNTASRELLEEIPGISFKTVSAIIERRGSELGDPKTPFVSVEEVRALENVSDEEWFGHGGNPGLKDLLTIWGNGKININTASEEVLRCIPDLDQGVLEAILAYRKGPDGKLGTDDDQGFRNLQSVFVDLDLSVDHRESLERYCKTQSKFFTITGFATQRQGRVRAASVATVRMHGDDVIVLEWREKAFDS